MSQSKIAERVEEFGKIESPERRNAELTRLYGLADLATQQAFDLGRVQGELNDARRQLRTMAQVIDHLLECEDGHE